MKRFNICTKKTYEKDGEEKAFWPQAGTMVKFEATNDKPEGYVLELNMFPDTKFFVFEQKPREQGNQNTSSPKTYEEQESRKVGGNPELMDDGPIDPDDIPF